MTAEHCVRVAATALWTAPDAPREVDAPAIAREPDVQAWVSSMDLETRLGLHGRILSQALVGEPVQVLTERGEWSEVVLPWQPSATDPRGYRGWVRTEHLTDERPPAGPTAAVRLPTVDGLSYGTVLPVLRTGPDEVTLWLPGRPPVSLPRTAVVAEGEETGAGSMLAWARQFLGMAYLWGGTCGWGMDCSGIVHLAHRVLGVVVPRDASDQQGAARRRPIDRTGPGDLLFFARPGKPVHHVGFVTSRASAQPTMLHAPESGQWVEEAPLAAERQQTLVSAGTFLG